MVWRPYAVGCVVAAKVVAVGVGDCRGVAPLRGVCDVILMALGCGECRGGATPLLCLVVWDGGCLSFGAGW